MRSIKTKEGTGIKRLNINITNRASQRRFKSATAAQGLEMTIVLLEFIEKYVAKNGPVAPKEGQARMKRAALYMRVSTVDQHPETQLLDLRQMAAQRGYRDRAGVHRPDQRREGQTAGARSDDGRCPPRPVRCRSGLGVRPDRPVGETLPRRARRVEPDRMSSTSRSERTSTPAARWAAPSS